MLNDVKRIKSIDKNNMMKSIISLPQQIRYAMNEMANVSIPKEYSECQNIVAIGMGGSGIPGDFLRTIYFSDCSVPILVHKDYGLPTFVSENTLVLAVSYTGTTEETIDAFFEARKRNTKIFGISSGDKLLKLLIESELPHFVPPKGRTTRESFGYLLFSMVKVLEILGYIPDQQLNITSTVSLLEKLSMNYAPEIPVNDNEAKRIATKLYEKLPIIYGSSELTDVVGLRWKHQINENSKVFAQLETFPDVTHNQLAAIANPQGMEKEQLCAVLLRNKNELPLLNKRIDEAKRVLVKNDIDVIEHWAQDANLMASLLSQSYLGDFVSMYLAVLNGVDPTPTKAMSDLKKGLGLTDLSPQ